MKWRLALASQIHPHFSAHSSGGRGRALALTFDNKYVAEQQAAALQAKKAYIIHVVIALSSEKLAMEGKGPQSRQTPKGLI